MAAFVAKQMLGNQLSSAKGAMPGGGDDSKKEKTEEELEAEREMEEARREAEDARVRKHEKFEAEREGMRQGIRDKVSVHCAGSGRVRQGPAGPALNTSQ